MIKTSEAIRTARALIGTPYSELDCINLIKKVIRTAPGGDKKYTTAGTNDLWNSDSKSAKYRDLTWKQEGISGAKAGMLAFMGVGTGDVSHTGLVTERGTVIHSSKSRGCVVETELTEILSRISGAGQVSVRIYVDSTNEKVLAEDSKKQSEISDGKESVSDQSSPIISSGSLSGSGSPYVVMERLPCPTGVVVVAEGAKNETVRNEIYEAVKALYGLPANRIRITY